MKLTLDQLSSFYWVARLGGFRAAAKQQHVSQPTVSGRIRELERVMDTRLFERDQHTSTLTPAGRDVLRYAERILQISDEMLAVGDRTDALKGVLRLGANESTALSCLTDVLLHLRERHPALRVELTVDIGVTLCAKLNAREIDVAILTDPITAAHVTDVRIGVADLEWVGAEALISADRVYTAAEFASFPIFSIAPPSTLYEAAQNWFSSEGVIFEERSLCNSMAVMKRLVCAGHAVAILPPALLEMEIASGLVHILKTATHFTKPGMYISYLREVESKELRDLVQTASRLLLASKIIVA